MGTYSDPSVLREAIRRERGCGVVTLDIVCLPQDTPVLDACNTVVASLGDAQVAKAWIKIKIPELAARRHLTKCLCFDQAYGVPCIPKKRSEEFVEAFLALFGDDRKEFFTNTMPWVPSVYERARKAEDTQIVEIREDEVDDLGWDQREGGWVRDGLSRSGFDTGVVVIGQRRGGLLWFEDED
jgi:hypothetical protein